MSETPEYEVAGFEPLRDSEVGARRTVVNLQTRWAKQKKRRQPLATSTPEKKPWKPSIKIRKPKRSSTIKPIKSFRSIRRILLSGNKEKIRRIDNESFRLMLNILANILNERILLKPELFKKMYKHRGLIRKLADPRVRNIERKKQILLNQTGGSRSLASLVPLIEEVSKGTNVVPTPSKAIKRRLEKLKHLFSKKYYNHKGGIFPFLLPLIPLLTAAAPAIAKAALGIGAAAAGTAASIATAKSLNSQ